MPLYEYQCDACEKRFERIQKYSDPPIGTCPTCGAAVRKLFSSPAIQFKGSGFYINDYAKKSGSDGKSGQGSEGGDKGSEKSGEKADTSDKSSGKSADKASDQSTGKSSEKSSSPAPTGSGSGSSSGSSSGS